MGRRLLLAALAGVSMLAGCAPAPRIQPTPPQHAQIGSFGFDAAGMDSAVRPGDDFYGYANGTWARTTPIPADRSNYGAFNLLEELSRSRTRDILEQARSDPASRIGRAYASFLDEAGVEARGIAPIQPWLARVKALTGREAYPALAAEATMSGIPVPFQSYVGQDDKHPEGYALFLVQSGLGLPDRDYYLSADPTLVAARTAYQAYLARVFALLGEADGEPRAKAVLVFETAIARVSWTRTDSRDSTRTYNPMTLAQLQGIAPGFDFSGFVRGLGASADRVIVAQPSAVTGIAALLRATPLEVLRDQLLLRSIDSYADYLPRAFDQASFAFHGTVLSGTPEREPRWKRAVDFTTNVLGEEVGRIYVARHFPPATKAAADTLVRNIIAAMGQRIDRLDWMAPETKARAHAKLAAFTPKIGYPDRWRDYAGLEVKADDLFGNAWRSARFEHAYNIGKLGKAVYRWEWGMLPMTVNAYANPGMVEIVFPAAILQPPFFDPAADSAVNYGGIGAVIGHELSHHFDDQGSKYDAAGRLTDWWTPQDVARFNARTAMLVRQYDAYEPLPGQHVQGALTLGENIADLAGLTVAHDAYLASLGGKVPPVIDGYSGDQRFYLGWAQVWRRSYRDANLRQRLLTDPHSPSQQRTWVVRNLDPWYTAFAPRPGEKLYLEPARRVRIW